MDDQRTTGGPAAGSDPAARHEPTIRTMESDVAELFRDKKPTLGSIVRTTEPGEIAHRDRGRRVAVIAGIVLAVAALGGAGAYVFFLKTGVTPEPPKPVAPEPFFATEATRTVAADPGDRLQLFRLLDEAARAEGRSGTMTRIVIKSATTTVDGKTEDYYYSLADLIRAYRIGAPATLVERTKTDLMVFFHYPASGARFGVAAKTNDSARTFRDMLEWESTMPSALAPFLFGEEVPAVIPPFKDMAYRNIDWRWAAFYPEKDIGIGYAVFPAKNYLIITTAQSTMEKTIDRLFDAR